MNIGKKRIGDSVMARKKILVSERRDASGRVELQGVEV